MTNHTKPIRIHHSCGMCRIWDTWSDVFLRKCFFWVFLQSSISVQWFDILISRLISSLRCLICYLWCFLQYEELQLKNIKKARIARFLLSCLILLIKEVLALVSSVVSSYKRVLLSCFWVTRREEYFLICGHTQKSLSPISSSWQIKKVREVDSCCRKKLSMQIKPH